VALHPFPDHAQEALLLMKRRGGQIDRGLATRLHADARVLKLVELPVVGYRSARPEFANDVERLLAESEDYDVAIIGATREGQLQQFVFGAIPEEFTRRAPVTTLVTKRNVGLTSRLVRLVGQGMPDYRSTEPRTQESSGERRVRMGRGFPSDAENRRGDVAARSAAEIPVAFHLAMVMVERCT
jgi:hypothetical protein